LTLWNCPDVLVKMVGRGGCHQELREVCLHRDGRIVATDNSNFVLMLLEPLVSFLLRFFLLCQRNVEVFQSQEGISLRVVEGRRKRRIRKKEKLKKKKKKKKKKLCVAGFGRLSPGKMVLRKKKEEEGEENNKREGENEI